MGICDRVGIHCTGCATLPRLSNAEGRLYLFFSRELSLAKVQVAFPEAVAHDPRALSLAVPPEGLAPLLTRLGAQLTRNERADVKVLFKEGLSQPGFADLGRVSPLDELVARGQGDWLIGLMLADRMTSHFQPIVRAKSPSTIFAQEALLRGIDEAGMAVPPGRMFDAAREAGLLVQLDQRARDTAVRSAAQGGLAQPLFMNLNPAAITEPASCLQATLRQIDAAGLKRERIVFEIVETDRARSPRDLELLREYCRDEGVRIALDDFGAGYSSVTLLHRLRPEFVKLDRDLVSGIQEDRYKAAIVDRLLELCRSLGILTVAEGVETDAEHRWFVDHGADLAQGFLFAKPAPLTATPLPVIATV